MFYEIYAKSFMYSAGFDPEKHVRFGHITPPNSSLKEKKRLFARVFQKIRTLYGKSRKPNAN